MTPIRLDVTQLKAVVFDLDNTLVSSSMDFQWLRNLIGCPSQQDILAFVEELSTEADKQHAYATIIDYEMTDALSSHVLQGAKELLHYLGEHQFHTAIVTRNCIQASQEKLARHELSVNTLITRDDFPAKPNPSSLLALASQWGLQPQQVLYVGDYLYDLQAAYNADMPSCLIHHGTSLPFEEQASVSLSQLDDLQQLLESSR